jgi:hypothetical protein
MSALRVNSGTGEASVHAAEDGYKRLPSRLKKILVGRSK